jgi:hypothetical protein
MGDHLKCCLPRSLQDIIVLPGVLKLSSIEIYQQPLLRLIDQCKDPFHRIAISYLQEMKF